MTLFIVIGLVCTLLAVALVVGPLLRRREDGRAPVAAVISALLIPVTVAGLYFAASNHDWNGPRAPVAVATAPDMAAAADDLKARLTREPGSLDGWLLLGRSYVQLQRFDDARLAFETALELSNGTSNEARMGLAEAQLLADPDSIGGQAGELVEAILAEEPGNARALWYGGMVALMRDDADAVRDRWQRLLALSPPDPIRRVIEEQLALLGPAADPPALPGTSVTVTVSVAGEFAEQVRPDAPLFLVARDGEAAGPPVAAIRRAGPSFPVTLTLSDNDVMLPGRSLGDLQRARIIARVANGGDARAMPGDIYGTAEWTPGGDGAVSIVIDRLVTP